MAYQVLNEQSILTYLRSRPALAELLPPGASLTAREVGDGNLNAVYIVQNSDNPKQALIIKQALPYLRLLGEDWKLTRERIRFESQALRQYNQLTPGLAPQVYDYDEEMSVLAMEYLGEHLIMRRGLVARQRYPHFAEHIATFMARNLFFTSDLSSARFRWEVDGPRAGHFTHWHFDDGWHIRSGKAGAQGRAHLGLRGGADALGTKRLGHFDKIWVAQVAGNHPVAVILLLHAPHVAISIVIKDQGHRGDLVLHGGGQLLHGEHKAAIPRYREDGAFRLRHLDPQRGGKTPAQSALIATGDIGARLIDGQGHAANIAHLGHLFDKIAVIRQLGANGAQKGHLRLQIGHAANRLFLERLHLVCARGAHTVVLGHRRDQRRAARPGYRPPG